MATLFCPRPHPKTVDYETSRFVVASGRGLDTGEHKLERGDEIPAGALGPDALRLEYQLLRIELASYAASDICYDSDLREACARRGVVLVEPVNATSKSEQQEATPQVAETPAGQPVLDSYNRADLAAICKAQGLSTSGTIQQLRERIRSVLG